MRRRVRRSRALSGATKFQVGDCVQRTPKVWKLRGDDTDVYNFLRITAIEPGSDNRGRPKQGYRTRLVKVPDDTKHGTTYLESELIPWKCPKKGSFATKNSHGQPPILTS